MKSEDERLLPLLEWDGKEFLVDVAGRQFRNVNDPGGSVDMHSPLGRTMVRQMRDTHWHTFAVDSASQTGATV